MTSTDPTAPASRVPTGVSVTGPDDGESIQLGPVRMRILEDGSTTGHRLGIGEITLAPHTDGPPQHRHARHDEGFYVVSGTARFTVGETTVILNTFTPDLYVEYFRDLRDMIAGGRALTPRPRSRR